MVKKNARETKTQKRGGQNRSLLKDGVTIFSWVAALMLGLSAVSVYINPNYFRFISILGLAFPFFVGGVLCALVACLLFARRKCWIPLGALLACFGSIRSYCPVNIPSAHPKDSYKIITYNTLGFASTASDTVKENGILDYVARENPDFFCFQEGTCSPVKLLGEKVLPTLHRNMPYSDTVKLADNTLGCTSKYPILKKEKLCQQGANGSAVFYLLLAPKDTLRLINCHLQSMGLSQDERTQYHDMVRKLNDNDAEKHSRLLISKISKASVLRADQADSVAAYIERNKGKNIIVCGDFNDTPISYAHQRIRRAGMTDAYAATANGIGRSFNRDAIYVRIDHLLCSGQWKPFSCRIDNSIASSDHYPLVGYLKRVKAVE